MFVVACNRCFVAKTIRNSNKYFISDCGHIFCESCLPNGRCRLCKGRYVARPIDESMNKLMAQYFENPVKLFRRFQKILQFQRRQNALKANYWINFIPRKSEEAKKKMNGLMRIDVQLSEKLDQETKRIEKLKHYLAYKKRKLEDFDQSLIRTHPTALPIYNRYSNGQRIKTPTMSTLSDRTFSTVMSVDSSRQSNSFTKRGRIDFVM